MSIEAIGIPILMKAIDFLFNEAKNIMEERRAARQSSKSQAKEPPEIPLLDQPKETVVRRKVSEDLVKRKEQAIQGILTEVEIYQQNYQRLRERIALYGGVKFAPVGDVNQMEAQQDAILEASQRLAALVDEVEK